METMKALPKTIKKQWFDMIAAGIKKHEYLEIKPYWASRFIDKSRFPKETKDDGRYIPDNICFDILENGATDLKDTANNYFCDLKEFDVVHAFNGGSPCLRYANIKWEHKGITIGEGNPEWGAEPGKKYFILHIGDIIYRSK